jgi:hypothetical protein
MQKAIHKMAVWNDTGTTPIPPSSSFVVFTPLLDSHFLKVSYDSAIIFYTSFGSPSEHI